MKKTDLEKNKGLKINAGVKRFVAPGHYGRGAEPALDRREQRKRDQALGLVPFAVKLDGELVRRVQALAQARQSGLSEVVAELLERALKSEVSAKK